MFRRKTADIYSISAVGDSLNELQYELIRSVSWVRLRSEDEDRVDG